MDHSDRFRRESSVYLVSAALHKFSLSVTTSHLWRGQRRFRENRRLRRGSSSWKITLKFEKFDGMLETDWSSLGGTLGGRLQLLTERIFLLPSTANRLSETVGSFVKAKNHVHEIYFDFIFFRLHRLSVPFPNVDLSWNKLCYSWLNIRKWIFILLIFER